MLIILSTYLIFKDKKEHKSINLFLFAIDSQQSFSIHNYIKGLARPPKFLRVTKCYFLYDSKRSQCFAHNAKRCQYFGDRCHDKKLSFGLFQGIHLENKNKHTYVLFQDILRRCQQLSNKIHIVLFCFKTYYGLTNFWQTKTCSNSTWNLVDFTLLLYVEIIEANTNAVKMCDFGHVVKLSCVS